MTERDDHTIHQERDITDARRTSHETIRHSGGYEATELGRLRSRYSSTSLRRSHSQTTSGIQTHEVSGYIAKCKASVGKFWRNQISITAPHDSCRDHLGESTHPSYSMVFLRHLSYHLPLSFHCACLRRDQGYDMRAFITQCQKVGRLFKTS